MILDPGTSEAADVEAGAIRIIRYVSTVYHFTVDEFRLHV